MSAEVNPIKNGFLPLAGPFCLLLTLAIAPLVPSPNSWFIPWLALFGLSLCWKFSLRGLALTLFISGIILAWTNNFSFWDLGLCISMIAGWCAMALAVDLEAPPIEKQIEVKAADLSPFLETIQQQKGEIQAQQSLLERIRQELVSQIDRNGKLQEEERQLKTTIEAKENQQNFCLSQLEMQQQLAADLEAQLAESQNEASAYRQTSQRHKGLHEQLRQQFDLKSAQLDEARQKLFLAEEELNRLLNENWERECEGKTPWLRDLEELLVRTEELYEGELERLTKENKDLEELLSIHLVKN